MLKLIKYKLNKIFIFKKFLVYVFFLLSFFLIFESSKKFIFTYSDSFLENLGFKLTEIKVDGNNILNKNQIIEKIKYKNCSNLFCVDLNNSKSSLEELDWVKTANLKYVLPSKLKIEIIEQKPKFILNDQIRRYLLNAEGKIITKYDKKLGLQDKLVSLTGENVSKKINDLKTILDASPDLSKKIISAKLVSERRWSLVFSNLVTLDLPEKDPELAFRKLDIMNKKHGLLHDSLKKIDLRVKDRMIIKFKLNDNIYKESKT